jgi:hypothetical protein
MPNCFQLTKIGEEEPSTLVEIDNALWLKFEGSVPEPNDYWFRGWYDSVGFELALGRTFTEIRAQWSVNSRITPVVEYLEKHYTVRCWAEKKK